MGEEFSLKKLLKKTRCNRKKKKLSMFDLSLTNRKETYLKAKKRFDANGYVLDSEYIGNITVPSIQPVGSKNRYMVYSLQITPLVDLYIDQLYDTAQGLTSSQLSDEDRNSELEWYKTIGEKIIVDDPDYPLDLELYISPKKFDVNKLASLGGVTYREKLLQNIRELNSLPSDELFTKLKEGSEEHMQREFQTRITKCYKNKKYIEFEVVLDIPVEVLENGKRTIRITEQGIRSAVEKFRTCGERAMTGDLLSIQDSWKETAIKIFAFSSPTISRPPTTPELCGSLSFPSSEQMGQGSELPC